MSAGSTFSLARRRGGDSVSQLPMFPAERSGPVYHPAPRRSEGSAPSQLADASSSHHFSRSVAMLQPLMVKGLSTDLFSSVEFLPDSVVTVSRIGQIKRWERPPSQEGELGALRNEFAASTVNLEARAR